MVNLPQAGGCNCGAVRYVVSRQPVTCYLCHCHLCQKRTGSPFSMTLRLAPESIELVSGEPVPHHRTLKSGAVSTFWSCGACGSRLWGERSDSPGAGLRAGTLDDTSWLRPVAQIWTSSAQPWAVMSGILSYPEQPPDFRPMIEAWRAMDPRPGSGASI